METNPPVVYIVDDDEAVRTSLAWLLSSVNIRTECFDGPGGLLEGL
jgi:FixJ family two-component response regulator